MMPRRLGRENGKKPKPKRGKKKKKKIRRRSDFLFVKR